MTTDATTPDDLPPLYGATEPPDAGAGGSHEVTTELADLHGLMELDNLADAEAGLRGVTS